MLSRLKQKLKSSIGFMALGASLVLVGCGSTGSGYTGGGVGPTVVGPNSAPLGTTKKGYAYNKSIFLDVAVPILDPGFPMKNGNVDEEEMVEQNIWPEIRRLEAKRFANNVRDALDETKSFSSVRVVPDPGAAGDLYVIGRINESNTMDTRIGVTVIDATNRVWGEKDFKWKSNSGFYRDARNKGKDPNAKLYTSIATWVYKLIQKKKVAELENVKLVADMRYAAMYSPEAFSGYLSQRNRRGKAPIISVNGLPADSDAILSRVREYEAQDMAFVDGLQDHYDAFYAETEDAYRTYQEEALPLQEQMVQKRKDRNTSIFLAGLATVAAVAASNQDSNLGDVVAVGAAIGAVAAVKNALDDNDAISEYRSVYDEVGQNLDLQVSPQVRAFEDKEIELKGTAAEQYQQWRAHLIRIYQENETPSTQL